MPAPHIRPPAMSDVFYLVLRRMRFPFILIISVYSFCVAGFAMIPGTDPATGDPTNPMTLFEAFYVVSFTAATIGFGEIPVPFNSSQRLWMTMTVYVSVAAWYYSLAAIVALLQDKGFQSAVATARFRRLISQLREPFYIVCGTGETGRMLCHGLDHLGLRFVAVEKDADKIRQMRLGDFSVDNPMLAADASQPIIISQAGLNNSHCRGVVALTDDDATNQAIAVTVKLMAPRIPVLARIRNVETETHIGVFGGDVVINPFGRFADYLAAAITMPERYRLRELITGLPGEPIRHIQRPPRGHWIICGYGRFGQAVAERLRQAGMQITVVDNAEDVKDLVDVVAIGTNSEDLKSAGIDDAVGLVTGHASDTVNLSIAVTARAMKRDIYIVNRQNLLANAELFDAFDSDLVMLPSKIVAQEFIARITTPLLNRFLRLIPQHNEADCARIYERLANLDVGRNPELWDMAITETDAPALTSAIAQGRKVEVAHLIANPLARDRRMNAMVLLIRRGHHNIQLPDESVPLEVGDRLLIAGNPQSKRHLDMMVRNDNVMLYILTGQESNGGYLWRWLTRHHPAKIVPLPPRIKEDVDFDELDCADDSSLDESERIEQALASVKRVKAAEVKAKKEAKIAMSSKEKNETLDSSHSSGES